MAIPENQLKTWAKRQSTQKAIKTHKTIRKALKSYSFSRTYNFSDYLQGSYIYVPAKRKNTTLDNLTGLYFYEGITFKVHTLKEQFTENFNDDGEWIINFPKLHYKNGVEKNKRTNNKFKPVVRIFKNMRNKAIEESYLESKNIAPSYFIQCLLYNIPNYIFKKDTYQEIIENILDWLSKSLSDEDIYFNFVSQNEIVPLFGSESDKWDVNNAREYIKALSKLWNDWNKSFLERLFGI